MKLEFYISPHMRKLLTALKDYETKSLAIGKNPTNQRFIPIKVEILDPISKRKKKK